MITGIHFLLTYMCNRECDHCFVYSGPQAKGTFTLEQLKEIFKEINKVRSVEWVYFEGGEPFLFYQVMVEGLRKARENGLNTGVVTNAYWATADNDAKLWLKPLSELDVSELSISSDSFHSDDGKGDFGKRALAAAKKLGINADIICIDEPSINANNGNGQIKGEPVVGGSVKFRGRAAEKLTEGLPLKPWQDFTECPYEELRNPGRVHLDSYGNVHLCQGLIMGNMWRAPLSEIIENYNCDAHPICRYLADGGPALLADKYGVHCDTKYVDACHLCYQSRLALIHRFPEYLAPEQVYGMEEND